MAYGVVSKPPAVKSPEMPSVAKLAGV